MSKSDKERRAFLEGLRLNPDGPLHAVEADLPTPTTSTDVPLAPDGVNPHTMPVSDIVFDPRLLDGFPNLDGPHMATASRYLFDLYKSPTKNSERHKLLHRLIGEFITRVRRNRQTGGIVPVTTTEQIKVKKEHRDLAALIAAANITAEDLAAFLPK